MSNYIEEARKKLALWDETIDIDIFTEQYESLDHCSGGVLLEDESLDTHYQFVTSHLKSYDAYDSVLVDLPNLKNNLESVMVENRVGKSLMTAESITGWIKDGKNILFVSLETPTKEVMKRNHNSLNIPAVDLTPYNFNEDIFRQKLKEIKSRYGEIFITQ